MNSFAAIRIEGGLFGPDTLDQLFSGDLPGQKPRDFGLDGKRSLTDEIASVFADACTQWKIFCHRLDRLPEHDPATSVTRDAWMIPFLSLLGYELHYNTRAYEVDGLSFAVSHRAGENEDAPPVHIVGARQELGRVPASGRPRLAPHSLVQEFLNRTERLWGIVTNGKILRLLRDSTYVRRQAYVEFDLEQILEEQRFHDFAVLYRLLHRSRLPQPGTNADQCWLEQYHKLSVEQGGRVRERLRDGVEECIKRLADGFLGHRDNTKLRERIASGERGVASSEWRVASSGKDSDHSPLATRNSLPPDRPPSFPLAPEELYRQLLRLVYRFLFLLVSEDRGLISADPVYREHYGVARLRRLLDRRSAYTEHDDLWCSLRVLWKVLSDERLATLLATAPLNGELFAPLDLDACTITNRDLLEAFWHLAYYQESSSAPPRRVNYAALDVEELGSVYESLLDYHPQIDRSGPVPRFELAWGSERKSTGSYYTPPELVAELIRSALEPVIEERLAEAKRLAEEIKRVASSEWRVVVDTVRKLIGGTHADTVLSRLGGLAESHGFGRTHLSHNQELSEGGSVWSDEPDAPGSNISAGEHHRGMGAPGDEGISSVPQHRLGQPARAGDLLDPDATSSPSFGSGSPPHIGADPGSQPPTGQPPAQSQTKEVTSPYEASGEWRVASRGKEPDDSPLATRHSPTSGPSPLAHSLAAIWSDLPLATRYSLLAQSFAEAAILSIRVLDPACGSGHFLLAAARRLGKELARIRTGEDEPAPERVREAIRDVVAHCIYGVDKNPLAVELCRVALWLEAHCQGKPLTFLDHRIRCGDSLVGVMDLDVLEAGIPDEAFASVAGDDKRAANLLKKRNRNERRALEAGQLRLPLNLSAVVSDLGKHQAALADLPDDSVEAIVQKARQYDSIRHSQSAIRQAADLWTAAFFQRMGNGEWRMEKAITTQAVLERLENRAHPQAVAQAEVQASRLRFFHWPLEFPEVFSTLRVTSGGKNSDHSPLATRHSPSIGFDVVLCNPPWEMVQHDPAEFFMTRAPEIAGAPNMARRRKMIEDLKKTNPSLYAEFWTEQHQNDCLKKFLHSSSRYPRTGIGRMNMAYLFAELMSRLINPFGRVGTVVPTGLMTDSFTQHFSSNLLESSRLVSLYDFENREGLFPGVHRSYKFSLLTLRGSTASSEWRVASSGEQEDHSPVATSHSPAQFAFFLTRADHLRDPQRRFALTAEDFTLLNPNTRTCPIFRTRQDAELTKAIYRRVPVLVREASSEWRVASSGEQEDHSPANPWGVRFLLMFMMNTDSHLFRTREQLERDGFRLIGNVFVKDDPHSPFAIRYLPLYEAKMIWHYDHRYGTYEGVTSRSSTQLPTPNEAQHADPAFVALPWYWVPAEEVEDRLQGWDRGWLMGWRDVTNATNERTAIFSLLPRVGVNHKLPLVTLEMHPVVIGCWHANTSTLVFDFVSRQKIGGTSLGFFILRQLPVLPPSAYTSEDLLFIVPRVLELVYTAWDLKPFADDVWADADAALREAIKRQWEENKATTAGVDPTPTDWLATFHSPLATRYSPSSPLAPFKWDEPRRARLRAELDAYYARLYGLTRKQLRYILDPADLTERELQDILDPWEEVTDPLDPQGYAERQKTSTFPGETFRVLKEKELRQFGEYRTRRLVLEAWEALEEPEHIGNPIAPRQVQGGEP